MKVPVVNINNNVNNTNLTFNAKFIHDKNGYFRKLWMDSDINSKFLKTVDEFVSTHKNHKLEIIEEKNNGMQYVIFNHRNGFSRVIDTGSCLKRYKLQTILDGILSSKCLFNEGSGSIIAYQKLTGQVVDKEFKI